MCLLTINRRVLEKLSPIAIGYFAIGAACGMLGQKAGLTPGAMFAMSTLVYAGSGQFIALAMMVQSASILAITLTIFIVNLRHVLFSSTLLPYLKNASPRFLALYAHGITDETFAVNLNAFSTEHTPPWTAAEALALNGLGCACWSLSTVFGCLAAEFLSIDTALVSYILIAMFLGIWSNYLHERRMIITGLASGVLALIFAPLVPYKLHIIFATLIASAGACYLAGRHKGGSEDV
ncbi:MAG: AzlC family ABC transporter permease [Acidaminococcaceae bacterium]